MIRVKNIRVASHLADFDCDDCHHSEEDINVNTNPNVIYVEDGGVKTSIRIDCWGGCGRSSFYPVEGGGYLSQQLALAKTA